MVFRLRDDDAMRSGPARSILKFSPMGTRIRFPGWDPQGFGTPLFHARPFHEGNVIGNARAGTGEPQ
jgi:hypothetical protein